MLDSIDEQKRKLLQTVNNFAWEVLNVGLRGYLLPAKREPMPVAPPPVPHSDATQFSEEKKRWSLPPSWGWMPMKEISCVICGAYYKKSDEITASSSGVRILRGGNIKDGEIVLNDDDIFVTDIFSDKSNEVHKGDIVIVASTGSNELIGKFGYARKDMPGVRIGSFLRIVRMHDVKFAPFVHMAFMSTHYNNYIQSLAKGVSINNIKKSYIASMTIPFPPVEEQRRIIAKEEEYFHRIYAIRNILK